MMMFFFEMESKNGLMYNIANPINGKYPTFHIVSATRQEFAISFAHILQNISPIEYAAAKITKLAQAFECVPLE